MYGQVGEGGHDHGFWGRPEDMDDFRPGFKIDANNPGTIEFLINVKLTTKKGLFLLERHL